MFGVEQLFTEIVKAPDGVLVPCLPKLSTGDAAQAALFPVSPLFGQRTAVAPLPVTAPLIVRLRLAVASSAGELESVAITVKEKVPDAVGVPLIWPELLSVNPPGKVPELTVQLYGLLPPLAASVAVYALLTSPLPSEVVVTVSGTAAAFTVSVAVPLVTVPAVLVTTTSNVVPLFDVVVTGVV
jgi:hypothetical protein